jgi:hypothetical protein
LLGQVPEDHFGVVRVLHPDRLSGHAINPMLGALDAGDSGGRAPETARMRSPARAGSYRLL